MCGFAGFLSTPRSGRGAETGNLAAAMTAAIAHRGPDGGGQWVDDSCGVALGHARLAIVDLSESGAQPMISSSDRYVIVYNGEIYNHMQLRQELQEGGAAPKWRGHSDTETLLAGIEAWGVGPTLERVIGMFAFALWDRRERALVLGRDRLGEKPLYYGWQGAGADAAFLFGSELKALARHPAFEGAIDRDALALFMRYSYIPAPHSIYRGIRKLAPGSYLTLRAGETEPRIQCFWSAREAIEEGVRNPLDIGDDEAIERLEALLIDAVGKQLMSDVPLGAFLSGGIDSSTVVALMQAQSSRAVKTFSIGFDEADFNEAEHAKAVAQHLAADHTELYVTAKDALDVIPKLPSIYDEPFADPSQIPTFLVCEMARRHVTVALSGDAGDELFGGYSRYLSAEAFWRRMSSIPKLLRPAVSRAVKLTPPGGWNALGRLAGGDRLSGNAFSTFGQLVHKGAEQLCAMSPGDLYVGMSSHWREAPGLVLGGTEPPTPLTSYRLQVERSPIETMMAVDLQSYLTDDILVKMDRAAMAVSLETRVPLLDHRVVEFAWRLPPNFKVRAGTGKWVLREVLYRHVPKALVERPKKGFSVPLQSWLRGPLRGWAEALLDETRLERDGYLNPKPIRAAWRAHLKGDVNLQFPLWNVLMFQAWLDAQNLLNVGRPPVSAFSERRGNRSPFAAALGA